MTNLTLTEFMSTSDHTKTSKRWKKLNKLWVDIEKKQQRNQKCQTKIDAFYQEFREQAGELEKEICEVTEQFAIHLIGFIQRKTIKGSQREELYDWIQEELQIIEANPFNQTNTDQTRQLFNQALTDYQQKHDNDPQMLVGEEELDYLRHHIFQDTGLELPLGNDELREMVNDPIRFQNYIQTLLEQEFTHIDDDNLEEGCDPHYQQDESHQDHPFTGATASGSSLFDEKIISKLFRQLAKLFHPDRATDDSKIADNLALMKELSTAKKNKDPITILLLAQAHLPDHKLDVDKELLGQLELALQEKIAKLNLDYQQIQHDSGIQSMIWQRFGSGSAATRKKTLQQHCGALKLEVAQIRTQTEQIRTVKHLIAELRQRMQTP
ncbi:J domain-containing protein, partial [Vibrio breoganii]